MREILETEEHVPIPPIMYSDPFYRITYLIKEEIRKYKWVEGEKGRQLDLGAGPARMDDELSGDVRKIPDRYFVFPRRHHRGEIQGSFPDNVARGGCGPRS